MQLHHIHPVVQPTCLPSQLLATGVGILHPKSRLHPYQVLYVQRIEADMCNLLVALASSLGSKKMKLEHEKLVVFLLLGAHEFTLHSQISLVEFSIGAQARVVLEPRATILEFSLVLGATIKHFLTWHHGVSFSVFHQGLAISFLTQGLLILWTGIMVYLEIHTLASSNGSEDRDVFPSGHSSTRVVDKPPFTIWEGQGLSALSLPVPSRALLFYVVTDLKEKDWGGWRRRESSGRRTMTRVERENSEKEE
ncbi:hypothetical protein ACFXTH_022330 [Malus domestica]